MLGGEVWAARSTASFFSWKTALNSKPDIEAATTDQMLTLVRSELGLAYVPRGADGQERPNWPAGRHLQLDLRGNIPAVGLPGLHLSPPAEHFCP